MDKFLEILSRAAALGPQALDEACEQVLVRLRPMDRQGARAVVGRDEVLRRAVARGEVQEALERLRELASARACIRCGTCCRNSTPALRESDLHLLQGLGREWFYTLRAGERVFSHRQGKTVVLREEIIKPREESGACVFLKAGACSIYDHRPLECRMQRCWAPFPPARSPRLSRAQALAGDPTALALAREYDLKIPAERVDRVLSAFMAGDSRALEEARELIVLDERLRLGIAERYGYSPQEQLLILGRPVRVLARAYCVAVEVRPAR